MCLEPHPLWDEFLNSEIAVWNFLIENSAFGETKQEDFAAHTHILSLFFWGMFKSENQVLMWEQSLKNSLRKFTSRFDWSSIIFQSSFCSFDMYHSDIFGKKEGRRHVIMTSNVCQILSYFKRNRNQIDFSIITQRHQHNYFKLMSI